MCIYCALRWLTLLSHPWLVQRSPSLYLHYKMFPTISHCHIFYISIFKLTPHTYTTLLLLTAFTYYYYYYLPKEFTVEVEVINSARITEKTVGNGIWESVVSSIMIIAASIKYLIRVHCHRKIPKMVWNGCQPTKTLQLKRNRSHLQRPWPHEIVNNNNVTHDYRMERQFRNKLQSTTST